jgi:hypothetical protein
MCEELTEKIEKFKQSSKSQVKELLVVIDD